VLTGVLLTAADTLLVLWFTRMGIRVIESFVLALVTVIATCFLIEIWWAGPAWSHMGSGLVPHLNGAQPVYRDRDPRGDGHAAQPLFAFSAPADSHDQG